MIINPIVCESCDRDLQPENLGVCFEGDSLQRVCGFCNHKVPILNQGGGKQQNGNL